MAPLLPLLHTTPIMVQTVDARLIALASLAFLAALSCIWFPEELRRLRRHLARMGAARVAIMAFLLVAVFPSAVPYDHLFGHADTTAAEESVHATHCHVAPGSCADAPLAAGPGQLIFTAPLIVEPPTLSIALRATTVTLIGRNVPPDLRPPTYL